MIHQGFLKFRILLIFFLGTFFFLFILGRALQLQLIPNSKLSELSQRQYKKAVTLFPKRGTIYDRDMNELAVSRKVGSLYAYPKQIKHPKSVAKKLSKLTGISYRRLYKKLRSKKSFVWIKRLMSDRIAARLKKRPIKGIGMIYEYKRFYPNQELSGQILGTVGVDSQGVEGIEYKYNDSLFGKKKSIVLIRDAKGRPITFDKTLFMESQEGNSLVLTIDKSLQFLVERELEAAVKKNDAKQAMALIQDVKTGEVLAMAHYPLYNPNRLQSYKYGHWKNRSVTDLFEPGSTFKIFLAALALEEGISPMEQFFCENGLYKVGKRTVIREAQKHKFKWLTLQDILKYSSNIGAAKVGARLGKVPFHRKIMEFGFGQKTNVGVPGEAHGIVRSMRSWSDVELSNISFGQGISVSAIQLITALSAIANDGKLMKPVLVKKMIHSGSKEVKSFEPEVVRHVITSANAKRLTKMLTRVTQKGGTGYAASLDGVQVAGKTGTAQKPNLKSGGYWPDKYISSFAGFFPADEPRYSIFVLLDEAKKQYYASQVAAPLFKAVVMHTMQIFPREADIQVTRAEPATPQKHEIKIVRSQPLYSPLEKTDIMPDFRGKSMRDVLEFATAQGLVLKVKGSGIATSQTLKEGTKFKPGQVCTVRFKSLNR